MKKHLYLFFCIAFITSVPYYSFSQIITTFAGNGLPGNSGNGGPATLARLSSLSAIAIDGTGNIYIDDQFYNSVRKVDPAGIITKFTGSGVAGNGGDGGPATAAGVAFNQNWGVAADRAGNVYITDQNNSKVRKVNTSGILTTIAGTGIYGDPGTGGPATSAKIGHPLAIACDTAANIYFTDPGPGYLLKVDGSGTITKIAGNGTPGGFGGDNGPATDARVSDLFGVTVDQAGNIYVCDAGNNRVRKITTDGIIATVAGNGTAGFSGDNGPAAAASINYPTGVFVTPSGYLYIADFGNNRIRKVTPDGTITTVAGTGATGYNGDNIPAINATLSSPVSVMLDTFENIYITDYGNKRVRKINNILSFTGGDVKNFFVCENSVAQPINSLLSVRDITTGSVDTWSILEYPHHGVANVSFTATSMGGIITPTGLTYEPASSYTGLDTFKVKVANSISSDVITIYVAVEAFSSAGTITGIMSLCVGGNVTLNSTIPGGTWSGSALAALYPLPDGCSVTGLAAGLETITYTISNSCATVFTSTVLTINPLPNVGVITGDNAVCILHSITLTESITGGTWSSSNDVKAPVTPTGIVTGKTPGVYTIAYTTTNAWCTAAALHQVSVEVFPDAGTLIGPLKICQDEQIVLTNAITSGIWSSSNGNLAVAAGTVNGVSVGSGIISYSVTNSCGTAYNIKTMTVNPTPDAPVISEKQGLLSVPANYKSYQWYLNGNLLPGSVSDTCSATKSGVYNVMVTNEFGCSNYSQPLEYLDCITSDLIIYPNPTSSILKIQWCKEVTVRLLCMDGKEVFVKRSVNEIDMSGLPNAEYLLNVFDVKGNKLMTKRITKLNK